jgi:hypothetical protein
MEQTDRFLPPSYAALDAEAGALLDHPGFDVALQAFCTGLTGFHQRVRAQPIGMPDTARWAVAMLILYLHPRAPAQANTATLIRLCRFGGLCGPAAVKGAIALLLSAGYVDYGAPADDARIRQLAPTARLQDLLREGLTIRLAALSHVSPLPASPADWAARPEILDRYIGRNVEAYAATGFKLYAGYAEVAAWMDRACGYILLLDLIGQARMEEGQLRSQLSPSDAAHRFGVSRTHVRKLLALGVEQGWVTSVTAGGRVTIDPAMYKKLRRWIALECVWTRTLIRE